MTTEKLIKGKERLVLIPLSDSGYGQQLPSLLQCLTKTHGKVCFASSNLTVDGFTELTHTKGLKDSQIVFVDTLSSHYAKQQDKENCLFVDSPFHLDKLKDAIQKAFTSRQCKALLLDSVSDYWSTKYVLDLFRLLNSFLVENSFSDTTKWVCIVKRVVPGDYHERIKDFEMLAERVVYLNH